MNFMIREFAYVNQKIEKLQEDKNNLCQSIVLVMIIIGLVSV